MDTLSKGRAKRQVDSITTEIIQYNKKMIDEYL